MLVARSNERQTPLSQMVPAAQSASLVQTGAGGGLAGGIWATVRTGFSVSARGRANGSRFVPAYAGALRAASRAAVATTRRKRSLRGEHLPLAVLADEGDLAG